MFKKELLESLKRNIACKKELSPEQTEYKSYLEDIKNLEKLTIQELYFVYFNGKNTINHNKKIIIELIKKADNKLPVNSKYCLSTKMDKAFKKLIQEGKIELFKEYIGIKVSKSYFRQKTGKI